MSELISGKEAWIAKSENKEVEWRLIGIDWSELTDSEFMSWSSDRFIGLKTNYQFRIKPRKITINGIEVPAPFEPKDYKFGYYMLCNNDDGWSLCYDNTVFWQFEAWRTEEEIKQVVAALRSVFNVK